jgi:hypothetical protein
MAKQLLIYDHVVPISPDRHRDWYVKMSDNYGFSAELNSVPLLAAEFAPASQSYAIVFAASGGSVFPAILLGQEEGRNLCVDANGKWTGDYIPAFLRRYPFVFAEDVVKEQGTFTLCIDEEFAGLNKDGRGERLFDAEGNRTQFLQTMLSFVAQFQTQFERTKLFCKRLSDLGLLSPSQARYQTPDGRSGALSGFMTIDREKLKAIPEDALKAMFATDELELCYLSMHSLQNFRTMGTRSTSAAKTPATEPVSVETEVPAFKARQRSEPGADALLAARIAADDDTDDPMSDDMLDEMELDVAPIEVTTTTTD